MLLSEFSACGEDMYVISVSTCKSLSPDRSTHSEGAKVGPTSTPRQVLSCDRDSEVLERREHEALVTEELGITSAAHMEVGV